MATIIGHAGAALALALGLAAAPGPAVAQRGKLLIPLDQLEARAARDSGDAAAQYDLGLAYLVKRRADDAERAFRSAIAVDSRFAPAYLGLAALPYVRRPALWKEVGLDKVPAEWESVLEEAEAWRRRAVMINPLVDLKVIVAVAPPREAMGLSKRELAIYTELMKGFEYFWDAQYQQAYDWFDKWLEYAEKERRKDDDRVPSWLLWYHGLSAAHILDYATAMSDFEQLLDRATKQDEDPDKLHLLISEANDFRYVLAVLNQRAERLHPATLLLEEVLTNDLGHYAAHSRLADIHEERKRWPAAVQERQRALESDPADPGLLFDLGYTLGRAGRMAEAVEPLRRALESNPLNPRISFILGEVLQNLGRQDEAREVWRTFLAVAPPAFSAQVATVRAKLAGGS
jgi:tetratricopeptide (TPR) repeat protein